jgi:hypothetical protein
VKAEYAYQGMPVPEMGPPLTFVAGDVFDLLSEDDPNWWEGRKDGKEGFFPKTYVKKHRTIQVRVEIIAFTVFPSCLSLFTSQGCLPMKLLTPLPHPRALLFRLLSMDRRHATHLIIQT